MSRVSTFCKRFKTLRGGTTLNQSGMTLIELGIALTITAALATIIIGFSVDKLEQSAIQSTKFALLSNAETGLDTMARDIRLSSAADDNNRWNDANAPGAPSNKLSWASNSTTLVLAVAAQNSSGNIIFDDAHDYVSAKNNVIYYLKNGSLYRRVLADSVSGNSARTTCPPASASSSCPADDDILDNVGSLSVQYFDGDNQQVSPSSAHAIQLSVTLKVTKYGQDTTASYTERMVFRNG